MLSAFGVHDRGRPDWADAEKICHEKMVRVRGNIERLVELLPASGYEFAGDQNPFVPARVSVEEIEQFEELAGPMPLALRYWFQDVGQVTLLGSHPDWDFDFTDALVIDTPLDSLLASWQEWHEELADGVDEGPFHAELSPDYLHKADVSGGEPYSLLIPNGGVDGLLLGERHQTTFVNYLRTAFWWAGFPGWSAGLVSDEATPSSDPPAMLGEIARRLDEI